MIILIYYLECKLGRAHDFDDVECSPADVITQHLKLIIYKTMIKKTNQSSILVVFLINKSVGLQRYTSAPVNRDIFRHDMNIDI